MLSYSTFAALIIATMAMKRKFIFVPAALATVLFILGMKFFDITVRGTFYVICVLWMAALCIKACNNLFENFRRNTTKEIDDKAETYKLLYKENEELVDERRQVR